MPPDGVTSHAMQLAAWLQEAIFSGRAVAGELLDRRWNNYPFGRAPRGGAEEYLKLFESTREKSFLEIDEIEASTGFAIDRTWLDELALHTQIVKKSSELAYAHGRLIYSLIRERMKKENRMVALETGTARGFSALCMAKAMEDSNKDGYVISLDVLPHLRKMYWNCIDDSVATKSRAELLAPWSDLLQRIVFLQGDTRSTLPRIGLERIHFAFLDAQHIKRSVLQEFDCVSTLQEKGDMVLFDDVTPQVFPGVVAAVNQIESAKEYQVRRLSISEQRGYAWAVKNCPGKSSQSTD
jgi:predicted O-methyltransferase YrrM